MTLQKRKVESKVCSKCAVEKPVGEFYSHKLTKSGLNTYCKQCAKEHSKKWSQENKNLINERRRQRRRAGIELRRVEKLNMTHKVCSKCGKLRPIDQMESAQGTILGIGSRCAQCKAKQQRAYVERNKEMDIQRKRSYYYENCKQLNRNRNKRKAKDRKFLTDTYVVQCIKDKFNISTETIRHYPELIEAQRLIIQTKRLANEKH